MNKKFSTLLTVGLLTGGALFSYVDAKDVTPDAFKAAIGENGILDITKLSLHGDKEIALTAEVDLYPAAAQQVNEEETPKIPSYVIIKDAGITLTSSGKDAQTFKGRLVIAANGVTVSNLNLVNAAGKTASNKLQDNTSIAVFASSVTVAGNTLTVSGDVPKEAVVNGITLYPQTSKVNYVIEGNKLEGFAKTAFDAYGYWYSSAFQVYQNALRSTAEDNSIDEVLTGLKIATKSAIITEGLDAAGIASNNTFSGNDVNVIVRVGEEVFADGKVNTNHVVEFV